MSNRSRTKVGCNDRTTKLPTIVTDCDVTTNECVSLQHGEQCHNKHIIVDATLQIARTSIAIASCNERALQLAMLQIT
jgi:hypothetical protein